MAWKLKETAPINVINQYSKYNIPDILAKVLNNRGVQASVANDILNNPKSLLLDPLGLVNVEKAVWEIVDAIESNHEIWVFGDYDADGATSGYTMSDFLQTTTDNDVYPYYPNRTEGYGISVAFGKMLIERRKETGKDITVITVDNGVAAVEAVDFLNKNNIKVIVTDHHQPKGKLPNCTIVNPQIVEDPTYKHLCGAGVAFKVVQAIETLCGLPKDYTSKYYYAVMIGTIADMMPLTVENMALIRLGLNQVNSKDCPKVIKVWKNFLGKKKLTPMDIGWEIGPRLNACGRMGNSDLSGMLLSYDEDTTEQEIRDTLLEIEDINQERKALTDKAKKEIAEIDFSNDYVCMFDASKYPAGIAGIIAGKLLEATGKPSIVYSGKEVFVGSARAPHGFNLQPLFQMELEKGNLLGYGGHEEAAGLSFSMEKMYELKESLNETVYELVKDLPAVPLEERAIYVDDEIGLSDINGKNLEALSLFAYDREVFTSPKFVVKDLKVEATKRSSKNNNNICLTVVDEAGKKSIIWAWGFGETYELLGEPDTINLVGELDINFMDKKSTTLRVLAIEAA